jgi:hypothetical protein
MKTDDFVVVIVDEEVVVDRCNADRCIGQT